MTLKYVFSTLLFLFISLVAGAQGLEDVIVETYYISDANDATDTDGGNLAEGSTTYRVYLDLAPGYKLETIFGSPAHELRIATTTLFFNNEDRGELTGNLIGDNRLDENTVALDSYLTFGGASESHFGVIKTDDIDGSVVGGENNDGGSEGIEGGLLINDDPGAGIPLTTADGLIEGTPPAITLIAANPAVFDVFGDENDGPVFSTNNGAWAVLGGAEGQTSENRILVAQITTDGELSFSLNIRVSLANGSGDPIDYVANAPEGEEVLFPALNFPLADIEGCTSPTACNFDPSANSDDGSCLEPTENCEECDGDILVLIDTDGDGVCDADEIEGCTDPEAINFNPNATEDDGSCEFEGVGGCTSAEACNFNPNATADDGSCLFPEINCTECNETNDALVLIDSDGDGVCDALEIEGCEDPLACNFDPLATDDDGSCLIPEVDCSECQGEELVLIDVDGDGICDGEEIAGCTDPEASNYNPEATDDDGTCEFLGITDISTAENLIAAYPNPVKDVLIIHQISSQLILNKSELRIFDIAGNKVHREILNLNGAGERQHITFPPVAEGLYLLEIITPEERYMMRIVKN